MNSMIDAFNVVLWTQIIFQLLGNQVTDFECQGTS